MQRIEVIERPWWRASAAAHGFHHAQCGNRRYWVDDAYYALTFAEANAVRVAAEELHAMCLALARCAADDPSAMDRLGIPRTYQVYVVGSLLRDDPSLLGRFDFVLDSKGVPKLLEYNADTPTAFLEASCFQREWFECRITDGVLPNGATQANAIEGALISRIFEIGSHFDRLCMAAAMSDDEDRCAVETMARCAGIAGLRVDVFDLAAVRRRRDGRLLNPKGVPINLLYKLYPWEYTWHDEFGPDLANGRTICLEPAWKMLIATKAILPLLWEKYPGHPNLLCAAFEDRASQVSLPRVRKPLHSREGGNITLEGILAEEYPGPFSGPFVVQAACLPSVFSDSQGGRHHPVIGAWIVDDKFVGIGVREDDGPVTTSKGRFVPHVVYGS